MHRLGLIVSVFLCLHVCLACLEEPDLSLSDSDDPGPGGGQVTGPDGSELDIPQGALADAVDFSFTPYTPPEDASFIPVGSFFRIEPADLTFDRAVNLSLPYNPDSIPEGRQEEEVRIWTLAEDESWQEFSGFPDIDKDLARAQILGLGIFGPGIPRIDESIGARLSTSITLDFGLVFLGETETQELILENSGDQPLIVASFPDVQLPFILEATADKMTVPVGGRGSLKIHFKPEEAGTSKDSFTFSTNEPIENPTHTVELIGRGVALDENCRCEPQTPCCTDDGVCWADDEPCAPLEAEECKAYVCDRGSCEYSHLLSDLPCNDGDPQTAYDTCDDGECLGVLMTCDGQTSCCDNGIAINIGQPCTSSDSTTNLCWNYACSDSGFCEWNSPRIGEPCTVDDPDPCFSYVCNANGACDLGDPQPDQPCLIDDPLACRGYACTLSGICEEDAPLENGTPCDDQDNTTFQDSCRNGFCEGLARCVGTTQCCNDGTPANTGQSCTPLLDPDDCWTYICNSQGFCAKNSPNTGASCDPLVEPPQCVRTTCNNLGLCLNEEPDTGADCDPGDARHPCWSYACNENSECATSIAIDGGICDIAATNPCYIYRCSDGACLQSEYNNGASCDDQDTTTYNDYCYDGQCLGLACPCSNETVCCDGCQPINNGLDCNDNNPQTSGDLCVDGVCKGTTTCECDTDDFCCQDSCTAINEGSVCDPGSVVNPCHRFTCHIGDCIYTGSDPDGYPCDVTDGTTASGACFSGVCEGIPLKVVIDIHDTSISAMEISPFSTPSLIAGASGDADGVVKRWELSRGSVGYDSQVKMQEAGHNGKIHTLRYATDGSQFASGAADGYVKVWSAYSVSTPLNYTYNVHVQAADGEVTALAFDPFGSVDTAVYSGTNCGDNCGWLREWNVYGNYNPPYSARFSGYPVEAVDAGYASPNKYLAYGTGISGNFLSVDNISTGTAAVLTDTFNHPIRAIRIAGAGNPPYLAAGSGSSDSGPEATFYRYDGTNTTWNPAFQFSRSEPDYPVTVNPGEVRAIAFDPNVGYAAISYSLIQPNESYPNGLAAIALVSLSTIRATVAPPLVREIYYEGPPAEDLNFVPLDGGSEYLLMHPAVHYVGQTEYHAFFIWDVSTLLSTKTEMQHE